VVDKIGEVVDLDDERFEPPPDTLSGPTRELVVGTFKLDGRLMLALDVNQAVDTYPCHHLMYSLVSAPVLGFDLTRLAGGSATGRGGAARSAPADRRPVDPRRAVAGRGRPRPALGRGGERGTPDAVA
jgi:hypothetical protein